MPLRSSFQSHRGNYADAGSSENVGRQSSDDECEYAESPLDGEFRGERTGREAGRGGIGHTVHNGGINFAAQLGLGKHSEGNGWAIAVAARIAVSTARGPTKE